MRAGQRLQIDCSFQGSWLFDRLQDCRNSVEQKTSVTRWILLFPVSVAPGPLLGEGDGSTKKEIIVGRFLFKIAMYLQTINRVGTNRNHRRAV